MREEKKEKDIKEREEVGNINLIQSLAGTETAFIHLGVPPISCFEARENGGKE